MELVPVENKKRRLEVRAGGRSSGATAPTQARQRLGLLPLAGGGRALRGR